MTPANLTEQIKIEVDAIESTIDQLVSLRRDIAQREPTVREVAAAGLFVTNLYNGVENVLKRISRFHQVQIPATDDWHLELFKSFCDPPRPGLPLLLDAELARDLAPFRKFRHVVHHGYALRLFWPDMLPGVESAPTVFGRFLEAVASYLQTIQTSSP